MSSRVRYLHCFSFLFNYASWSEALLTGTLMLFIPVVGPLIIHGWGVAVMHRRIRGEEGLPNFFDMGELIVAGLKPFLVNPSHVIEKSVHSMKQPRIQLACRWRIQ